MRVTGSWHSTYSVPCVGNRQGRRADPDGPDGMLWRMASHCLPLIPEEQGDWNRAGEGMMAVGSTEEQGWGICLGPNKVGCCLSLQPHIAWRIYCFSTPFLQQQNGQYGIQPPVDPLLLAAGRAESLTRNWRTPKSSKETTLTMEIDYKEYSNNILRCYHT